MFSRMRSLNRNVSCGTKPIFLRSDATEIVANRTAVDQYHSGFRVVDARNQVDQRRLARAGRADDREAAAGGHAQVHVVQDLLAFIAEVEPAEFDLALNLAVLRARSICDLRLLLHDFVDADQRRRAALEDVDDPSQRDDRPGELHHVGAEGDELSDAHGARESNRGGDCGMRVFQDVETSGTCESPRMTSRPPSHSTSTTAQPSMNSSVGQSMPIRRTSLRLRRMYSCSRFEGANLGLFLHVGANQARSGEILLRARGDVGEHGLDALEALVNAAAESLNDDADGGQRQEGVERQPRADRDHEGQRARGVDDRVGRVHDRRAEQHADRIQIVGGARHNVAGAIALVVGVGEAFEAREQIVAQVEFDVAGDADHDPAGEELEDSLGDGDGEQHCPRRPTACGGSRRRSDRRRLCRARAGKRIQMPLVRKTQSVPAM